MSWSLLVKNSIRPIKRIMNCLKFLANHCCTHSNQERDEYGKITDWLMKFCTFLGSAGNEVFGQVTLLAYLSLHPSSNRVM